MLTSSATSSGRATGSGRAATGAARASTGIPGLDDILGGGLTPDRFYLVEGTPGTGKTTLALQFLMEGVRLGMPALYITLSETADELRAVAQSHGWSLDGVSLFELVSETGLDPESEQSVLHPAEVCSLRQERRFMVEARIKEGIEALLGHRARFG